MGVCCESGNLPRADAKFMELYFKDLISKEASLEKLVDDLARVVQGADDIAKAVGQNLSEESREEVATRLDRLKASCRRLAEQAVSGGRATDRLVRRHPYSSLGIVFAAGLLVGAAVFYGRGRLS